KLNYLELPNPTTLVPAVAGHQVSPKTLAAHAAWVKEQKEIVVLMLRTMKLDLQWNLETLGAYDMLKELKTLFSQQAEQELLQTKMVEVLHSMLKLHEQTLPKRDAPALHAIRVGKNKKLPQGASTSSIFTTELFTFPGKYWVYDTGYGTHICNTTQGLRGSRKLKLEALSLYMGNGQRAAVEAILSYDLCFPSGLVIVLHNCHYALSITRGVISVSRLYDDGFINRFDDDNTISVSRNNLVYFSVVLRDGIYEIDLSNSNTNNRSMYVVSNKRAKLNLDSSLLWHCCLGHISKKRIEKLQQDGLLNSIDTKFFEKCV
ncbi:zinc finger, CCHC-type containing protein, partial [Tanacetum coccineum]